MQRISATFKTEEDVNKVLKALKDVEVATESIGNLVRAKAEVLNDNDQYMLIVDVDKNREEVVHTILKSAGGKGVQSYDAHWQPGVDWVTRLGIDVPG